MKLEGAELDAYYLKLREEREANKKAEMSVRLLIMHNPRQWLKYCHCGLLAVFFLPINTLVYVFYTISS